MRTLKKSLSLILSCLMIISCLCVISFAEGEKISVKLRIEGIKENFYNRTLTVDAGSTVLDALIEADKNASEIKVETLTFANGTYIQKINGEENSHFGGADAWHYTVNYVDSSDTIDKYKLKDGDSVIIYYGDPVIVGFDYPEVDLSRIEDGTVRFISYEKTYDLYGNPTYTVKPISNAKITWRSGMNTTSFSTNAKGEIYVPKENRTSTYAVVQIEKTAVNGLPMVLRFEPQHIIMFDGSSGETKINSIISRVIAVILNILRVFISVVEGNLGDILS